MGFNTSLAQNQKIKIALNWVPEPQFGGFYQALLDGEFKSRGLDVEILPGGSGTPTIQMLSKGTVDFGIVSAEEILISNDKNLKNPIKAIFATFQKNPQIIMSHAGRNFKSIGDILQQEGFLAWQKGLSYSLFLQKKYPETKVKMVPYLGGLSQFQKDKLLSQQGFLTSEPITAEELNLPINVFLVADEGFNPYTTVLAIKADYYNHNKALVEQMHAAVKAGWTNYLKDPSKTNAEMMKLNPSMKADVFKKSSAAQVSLIQGKGDIGAMENERWITLIQQMKDLALVKNKLKADNQFIRF